MATTQANGAGRVRPVLEAKDITMSYRRGPLRRRQPVLRGAHLELVPGQVVGMIGENGSGKSTLLKILVGAPARGLRHARPDGLLPAVPAVVRLTCDEHFDLFGHAYGMSTQAAEESRQAI